MEPVKLLSLIKKFVIDNPEKKPIYSTKDNDYLEQKVALDYLEGQQFIKIFPISDGFIEVEITEKGKGYKNS